MRFLKFYLISLFSVFLFACSDDDDGTEFMFDREISEYSVLKGCGSNVPDGTPCFKIRYHYPMRTDDYSGLCVWLGTEVIDDTSKSVGDKQINYAHDSKNKDAFFHEYKKTSRDYDTIDLTDKIAEFEKEGVTSLQVAMFSEYSDGGEPGAVQPSYRRATTSCRHSLSRR